LIDGFITRPGILRLLKPLETNRDLVLKVLKHNGIDHLDAVFVSHSHYDHALDVAYIAKKTKAKLYGSPSSCNIARGGKVQEMTCFGTDVRADYRVGDKFVVTVLPSKHSPPTLFNNDFGQRIEEPLVQPAKESAYKEGNTVDFLISHGDRTILVKPSGNFLPSLPGEASFHADVLFLGVGRLGNQDETFMGAYFQNSVGATAPTLVVPIHWDDFFVPLSNHLTAPSAIINNVPVAFDFLKSHLGGVKFRIMQGCQSILLFKNGGRDISEELGQPPALNECVEPHSDAPTGNAR
jgi:L-ascorbate metabolism protein UlaG (beta-lactamase superfamily)